MLRWNPVELVLAQGERVVGHTRLKQLVDDTCEPPAVLPRSKQTNLAGRHW